MTHLGTKYTAPIISHDPATGLHLAKTYADGAAVTNGYAADGLPLRTVLARGVVRESAYDANRRLASVSYSDGTPGHALSRDALGRVVRVDEGSGRVHQYAYDADGRIASESVADADLASVLSRTYDAAGRVAALDVTNAAGRALHVAYAFSGGRDAGYAVTLPGGSLFERVVRRDPEHPERVLCCSNFLNGVSKGGFSYSYDLLGRPVERRRTSATGDTFAYDAAGQLVFQSYIWGTDLSGTLQGAGGVGGLVAVSIGGQYYLPCFDAMGNVAAYFDESGAEGASLTKRAKKRRKHEKNF